MQGIEIARILTERDVLKWVLPVLTVVLACICIQRLIRYCRHRSFTNLQAWRNAAALLVIAGCLSAMVFWPLETQEQISTDLLNELPQYQGEPATVIHDNIPFFTEEDYLRNPFVRYGEQDEEGRCTTAFALLGTDMMPDEPRESISEILPSGWQYARYDDLVENGWLYHRCHLIAYGLAGENANPRNLVTGTAYMNLEGMRPYEGTVALYMRSTGNHVLYRVTPVFYEDELVCRGVLLEAYSLEDEGEGCSFCVYCYNVQPGIEIDYGTGMSKRKEG